MFGDHSTTEPIRQHRFDSATPAVVLKMDPNPLHHGGLGVIRGLGRHGIPVFAICEDPLSPAGHSRYLHGRWQWRPDRETRAGVLEGLSRLARHLGKPTVVLPTDDAGAILLAENASKLPVSMVFSRPPPRLVRGLAGKESLYRLCADYGVPVPHTERVHDEAQARSFARKVGYPLVAKLAEPWVVRSGRRVPSTSIVRSAGELADLIRTARSLVLQELLPAHPCGSDWFVHAYCGESGPGPVYIGFKERSYPAYAGLTSYGWWAANDELEREATRFLARSGYRGIVDMDWRFDPRDDRYKLLDCNPRLGAQFRLFHDRAGLDVAVAAYLDLTGQPVPAAVGEQGRRFVVENYDPPAALSYWRGGALAAREWLSSMRAADEAAWFARDDLAPFGLMCARMGWRALTRRIPRPSRDHPPRQPKYRQGRARRRVDRSRRGAVSVSPSEEVRR